MAIPCEKSGTIDHIEKLATDNAARLHAGDVTLNSIDLTLKEMKQVQADTSQKMTNLHNRMFIDNGKKSFQSALSNVSVHVKLQWFFIGAIVVSMIGASIKVWFF